MHIQISLCITLNKQFWILDQICPRKVFKVKNRKSEHHHWILHIQVSFGTKFSLKLTILIFWPDLPKKGFSGLKQKKWTPHIFYIILHIQISLVQNFRSNWQFWFFGPNLPKKGFPVENRKSEHHHEVLHITDYFEFLDQIYSKKVFRFENRTSSPMTKSVCFLCSKR